MTDLHDRRGEDKQTEAKLQAELGAGAEWLAAKDAEIAALRAQL